MTFPGDDLFMVSTMASCISLCAQLQTVPTLDNLRCWGNTTIDKACVLRGRPCTLRHVLNSCSTALTQGRFTWRHDNVLRVIKRHVLDFWSRIKTTERPSAAVPFIRFVPENTKVPVPYPPRHQIRRPLFYNDTLRCAPNWRFLFDVDGSYSAFPIEIAASRQRPHQPEDRAISGVDCPVGRPGTSCQ